MPKILNNIVILITVIISLVIVIKKPASENPFEIAGLDISQAETETINDSYNQTEYEQKDLIFELNRFKDEQLGSVLSYNAVEGNDIPSLNGQCVTGIRHFLEFYLGIETYVAGHARTLFEDFDNNYFGKSGQFTKIDGHHDVKVGDIYFKTHNQYGHVGIVHQVNDDGTYIGLDSNYYGEQKFQIVDKRFNFDAGFGTLNELPRVSDIDGVIRYNQ